MNSPPGTGKSTLLVSIICRYLLQFSPHPKTPNSALDEEPVQRRLMVCAPSNKAMSHLVHRFLSTRLHQSYQHNIIMVGDYDKIFDTESGKRRKNDPSILHPIFVFTWISTVENDFLKLKTMLVRAKTIVDIQGQRELVRAALNTAKYLRDKLLRSLPALLAINENGVKVSLGVRKLCQELKLRLEKLELPDSQSRSDWEASGCNEVKVIDLLTKIIGDFPEDEVHDDLIASAHVIFCTLSSAGSAIVKKSLKIDDLIVDEAAASIEPELYIPMVNLQPDRMLAVGDPLQLPATVHSCRALQWGLDISLHERLMYHCGWPHIMLDTQYRMKPEVAQFPVHEFYKGKVKNGQNIIR